MQAIRKDPGSKCALLPFFTAALCSAPTFGENDPVIAPIAARSGMVDVLWSVDSGDWVSGATASAVVARLLSSVRAGSIVLMHDDVAGMSSIAALEQALPILKARGLVPVTVSQLLVLDPPNMRKQRFRPIAACRK